MSNDPDKDAERKAQAARAKKLLAAKRKKKAEAEGKATPAADSVDSGSARPSLDERRPEIATATPPAEKESEESNGQKQDGDTAESRTSATEEVEETTTGKAVPPPVEAPVQTEKDETATKAEAPIAEEVIPEKEAEPQPEPEQPLSKSQKKKKKAQEKQQAVEEEKAKSGEAEREQVREEGTGGEDDERQSAPPPDAAGETGDAVEVKVDEAGEGDAVKVDDQKPGDGMASNEISKLVSAPESATDIVVPPLETLDSISGEQHLATTVQPDEPLVKTLGGSSTAVLGAESGSTDELSSDPRIKELEAENLELQERIAETQSRITSMESTISDLETQKSQLQTDSNLLAEAQGHISLLEKDLSATKERLEEEQTRARNLESVQSELEKSAGLLERTEGENRDMRKRVEELETEVERLRSEIKDWEQQEGEQRRALEGKLEGERERGGMLESELRKLKQSQAELEQKKVDTESELSKLKEEHAYNVKEIEEARRKYIELQDQCKEASEKASQAETKLADVESSLDKVKSDADTTSDELTTLRDTYAAVVQELEQSRAQLSKEVKRAEQAVGQKQALQEDNQGLLEQLEEVRGRIGQLAEDREGLGETIAGQKKKIAELEEQLRKTNDEYAEMNVEQDIIVTERDALLQEKTEAEATRRALSAQLEASTAEIGRAKSTMQALTDTLGVPGEDSEAILPAITSLKEKLSAAEARSTDTSKDDAIAAMQSQHAMEISERDSAIRRAEDEAHQQMSKNHEMSKRFGDMEQELASLRTQLSTNTGNATPRSDGQRSATFASPIPTQVAPPSASIDASLPPSMRHKRQVSLAMLKARMSGPPISLGGRSRSVAPDAVAEEEEEEHLAHRGPTFASQISDDAVFWCPECHGDLITL